MKLGKYLGVKFGEKKAFTRWPFLVHFWKHTKYMYIWGHMAVFLFLLPPDILELLKLESFSWLCMVSSTTLALSIFLLSIRAPIAHGDVFRTRSISRWQLWAASSLFASAKPFPSCSTWANPWWCSCPLVTSNLVSFSPFNQR